MGNTLRVSFYDPFVGGDSLLSKGDSEHPFAIATFRGLSGVEEKRLDSVLSLRKDLFGVHELNYYSDLHKSDELPIGVWYVRDKTCKGLNFFSEICDINADPRLYFQTNRCIKNYERQGFLSFSCSANKTVPEIHYYNDTDCKIAIGPSKILLPQSKDFRCVLGAGKGKSFHGLFYISFTLLFLIVTFSIMIMKYRSRQRRSRLKFKRRFKVGNGSDESDDDDDKNDENDENESNADDDDDASNQSTISCDDSEFDDFNEGKLYSNLFIKENEEKIYKGCMQEVVVNPRRSLMNRRGSRF